MKILFIGGSHDGEWREQTTAPLTLSIPIPVPPSQVLAMDYPSRPPVERYRLEKLVIESMILHLYIQEGMSKYNAVERLLRGYTPSLIVD